MDLLKSLLEIKGYEVKYTAVREEIPGMLDNFKPNLILMDMMQQEQMVEITGEAKEKHIPVLLMTGYANLYETPAVHPDGVIRKPFTMEQLGRKIEGLLG